MMAGDVIDTLLHLLSFGSGNNGLLPVWFQPITWTNADQLLNKPMGTNFSEILNPLR